MLLLIFLSIFFETRAEARIYDLYRSDRRFKGGFCAAMGGACAADTDIVTGIFENPASLATGLADWDFDGDYLNRQSLEAPSRGAVNRGESSGVLGVSYTTGKVGAGFAVAIQNDDVDSQLTLFDDAGLPKSIPVSDTARLLQFRIPVGFQLSPTLSGGVGLSVSRHTQDFSLAGSGQQPDLVSSPLTLGLSVGALYKHSPRLSIGSWFRLPTTISETVRLTASSLATSVNYTEDLALHYPWLWAVGTMMAIGDADQLFLELDVTGPSKNAFLYSYNTLSAAVNDAALTPKGRNLNVEPHAGYRMPLGHSVRLHTGAYYQPSRIDGLPGRLHGTAGVSFDAFKIAEVIGGVDYASNALQIIFTFR